MVSIYTGVLALLAFSGWAFSFYFYQVYRNRISPNVWWIPSICQLSEGSCKSIVDTPYGRIFGRPNAYWGTFYYPGLIVAVLLLQSADLPHLIILIPSALAGLFSIYLLWGLYRLHTLCQICLIIHVINFSILGLTALNLA